MVNGINDWIDSLGYPKIIVKCDNESSIKQLQREVADARKDKVTIPENPPRGDSSGIGLAESAVKEIEGFIRTHKANIKLEAGVDIPCKSSLMGWLVRHVGTIISRVKVNAETGLTAYEKIKGKHSSALSVPFGESVMFQPTG